MLVSASIRKHPVVAYFVLTFTISWGGVLLIIGGPAGMVGIKAQDNPLFPFAVLAMVAGPGATGLLLTAFLDGAPGLREFRSRLFKCRVDWRWYATALLAAPVLTTATILTLTLVSPEFLPAILQTDDKTAVLLLGLVVGLTAGVFEELGWTGFAIPRLTTQHGVVTAGLIVGLLWSAWHLLVVSWGIGDRAGQVPLPVFMTLDSLTFLPAFRVLMVWVYDHTESLLLGILMHVSVTATTLILWPQTSGSLLLAFDAAIAAIVWIVLGAIHSRPLQVDELPLEGQRLRKISQ